MDTLIFNKIVRDQNLSLLEKICLDAKKNDSIRTIDFWKSIEDQGYMSCQKGTIIKILELTTPIMDKWFPNNWDLGYRINQNETKVMPCFIFYFPEVTVTNSKHANEKHQVKKLFFKIDFNTEYPQYELDPASFLPKLYGTRLEYDDVEFVAHYIHSHLRKRPAVPDSNIFDFDKFCIGEAETLDVFASLKEIEYMGGKEEETKFKGFFELLMEMLYEHASVESEEGGPYTYIRTIEDAVFTKRDPYMSRCQVDISIELFKNAIYESHVLNNSLPNIDIFFNGRAYEISNNKKFEFYVLKILYDNKIYDPLMSNEDNEIPFIKENLYSFSPFPDEVPYTIFRGNIMNFKINYKEREEDNMFNYKVKALFLIKVKNTLEEEINSKIIIENGFKEFVKKETEYTIVRD